MKHFGLIFVAIVLGLTGLGVTLLGAHGGSTVITITGAVMALVATAIAIPADIGRALETIAPYLERIRGDVK